MTKGELRTLLCADWRRKQRAMLQFPLIEGEWMRIDRLAELKALDEGERAARARIDEFDDHGSNGEPSAP